MAKTNQSLTLFLLLIIWLFMNIISPTCSKSSSTMQFHPEQSTGTTTTTTTTRTTVRSTGGTGTTMSQQYYGVAAHEVPSGANPESNK